MKKKTSGSTARTRTRFCFVTLTVDHRRFPSVELGTEAGKRQLHDLLEFMRAKKAEIHRSMIDEAASVKHWHVLFSAERPMSCADIEAFWGLGRVNVVDWVETKVAEKYLLRK